MTTNISALYGIDRGVTGAACRLKSQTFTSSGIWQKPEGVEVVKVLLVGGGASGGVSSIQGNHGGTSSFGGIVFARGGLGNRDGGGIGSGIAGLAYYTVQQTTQIAQNNIPQSFTNGFPGGLIGMSSAFGSTGGGGGNGNTPSGNVAGNGGNVIGFGSGGIGVSSPSGVGYTAGGGGGASYGNGGNGSVAYYASGWIGTTAGAGIFGGGGGGVNGVGGGGGEIVIREVPVSGSVQIIIGAGGTSVSGTVQQFLSKTTGISGAGGNGLCIVYWVE